jgi:hypothetical protein
LFGSDLFGSVQRFGDAVVIQAKSSANPDSKLTKPPSTQLKTTDSARGALTRLTRKEINGKLTQIPVFFAVSGKESNTEEILTIDGVGKIFLEVEDAQSYLKSLGESTKSSRIDTATLGDVYYPLIIKKQKLGKFIEGVVGRSDASAAYTLVPSPQETSQVPPDWKTGHAEGDVPLFRVKNLAFQKESGLEIPLFLRKEDALSSFRRFCCYKHTTQWLLPLTPTHYEKAARAQERTRSFL